MKFVLGLLENKIFKSCIKLYFPKTHQLKKTSQCVLIGSEEGESK